MFLLISVLFMIFIHLFVSAVNVFAVVKSYEMKWYSILAVASMAVIGNLSAGIIWFLYFVSSNFH